MQISVDKLNMWFLVIIGNCTTHHPWSSCSIAWAPFCRWWSHSWCMETIHWYWGCYYPTPPPACLPLILMLFLVILLIMFFPDGHHGHYASWGSCSQPLLVSSDSDTDTDTDTPYSLLRIRMMQCSLWCLWFLKLLLMGMLTNKCKCPSLKTPDYHALLLWSWC